MRYYLQQNVYEAGLDRIRYVFNEFDDIIVWVSGGKDSTAIFHMSMTVAKELDRLPLKVAFIDQESEWQSTIDIIRKWMYRPDVIPLWYQIPFKLNNSVSFFHEWLYCWDEKQKDLWPREKESCSVKENRYGVDLFMPLFEAILYTDYPNERIGSIAGVRAEESPGRFTGLTSSLTYKDVTWGRKYRNKNHVAFYPLYDWSFTDIWKYILDNKLEYNKIYDLQHKYGIKVQNMRVSSLHHETSLRAIFYMQEAEPETFNKLTRRLSGISTAKHMGAEDYYITNLPFMFNNWKEYRDFLLEKLIEPKYQKNFKSWFISQDNEFDVLSNYDTIIRGQINALLCNDFECTKLKDIQRRQSNKMTRRNAKERKAK